MNKERQVYFLVLLFVFFTISLIANTIFIKNREEKAIRQQRELRIKDSLNKLRK